MDGVNLNLYPGEALGLVGESGSGKSSIARAVMSLMPPGGAERFVGAVHRMSGVEREPWRRQDRTTEQRRFDPDDEIVNDFPERVSLGTIRNTQDMIVLLIDDAMTQRTGRALGGD